MKVSASKKLHILQLAGDCDPMNGQEFKQHRTERRLNQRQWASLLGVSYSSVTKWETKPTESIPRYVAQQVEGLKMDKFTLKNLSPEQQEKLAKRVAESGKTLEEYVSDLLKAILSISIFGAIAYIFVS